MFKYILERTAPQSSVLGLADRPTQDDIKGYGIGEYTLRRPDGQVIRHYVVALNRNNNIACTQYTPDGLDGISTLNLNRMVKAYAVIVKHWTAKQSDLRKITNEIVRRDTLIADAQPALTQAAS